MDTKDNERRRAPGEAEGDGQALHGYRNEVSWDGGKGRQPYANQGDAEHGPASLPEVEAGDRGEASGRNQAQMEAMEGFPERPEREAPRK